MPIGELFSMRYAKTVRASMTIRSEIAVLLILAAASSAADAQTQTNVGVPGRGAGFVSMSIDYVTSTDLEAGVVSGELVDMTLRSLSLEFDYGLTERLALTTTLPLQSNRAFSTLWQHNPAVLIDDHGEEFLDTGEYHTFWADLGLSLRWQWRSSERLALAPFASYYTPSNDYPIYALSQPGRGQWRFDVGLNASGRLGPPRLNLYWKAGYAYSHTEKTRPADAPARRVNRSRLMLEMGWRATPRITPYVALVDTWSHNGVPVLEFSGIFVSDQWYYHDQLLPWEQTAWTIGAGYAISDQIGLSFAYGGSDDVEFGFYQEPAVSFGFTYGFARRR